MEPITGSADAAVIPPPPPTNTAAATLNGVRLASRPHDSLWDIYCRDGYVEKIIAHVDPAIQNKGEGGRDVVHPDGRLVTPSLCHPHIHLDKCFLFSHPKYADLKADKGDFAEALSLTSQAKSRFEQDDLLERGRALIEESIAYGVTHMRAFVEVDPVVGHKCLDAGLSLKHAFQDRCFIQICVFAQDPVFSSYEDGGKEMRALLEKAVSKPGVDVIGSTPYVESSTEKGKENIAWAVKTALDKGLLLDFHLDYNLDAKQEPMVYEVIKQLQSTKWPLERRVTLGHCTRMTLFSKEEWKSLRDAIGDLPISFVGLPTSDLFMMGRPDNEQGGGQRERGTLQIPQMIRQYGLDGAISINNVGNAFTPQGSCDPLRLASLGVGVYQAGTQRDAELLFECVSTRAKAAIGLPLSPDLDLRVGDHADFVVFGSQFVNPISSFRQRKSVQDLVYDAGHDRITYKSGRFAQS